MKIKGGFVTNSSSTSFILESNASGVLIKNCELVHITNEIIKIFPSFKNLEPKYKSKDFDYTSKSTKGSMKFYGNSESKDDYYNVIRVILSIDKGYFNTKCIDTNKFEEYSNALFISIKVIKSVFEREDEINIETTKRILKEIRDKITPDCDYKFFYEQHIFSFTGDGWGGDPMGPFEYEFEAMEYETFSKYLQI